MKNEDVFSSSPLQDSRFLQTLPLIRQIAAHKLTGVHRHAAEGIVQRVALKLWKWKLRHPDKELSVDEWQRLANSATQNEVKDFYSSHLRTEISLSEVSEEEIAVLNKTQIEMPAEMAAEVRSLLVRIWAATRQFSLRQKYALLLKSSDLITDLIRNEVCSLDEIAESLQLNIEELKEVIVNLPLSDERIRILLETKLQRKITMKHVWEARNKARTKLRNTMKIISNDGAATKQIRR